MAVAPGTRIGVYEVGAQIGAGGMGEVYRATDTRLDRTVAIKVLPESLAADAERIARFEREARTLAALNHPNIAAIHGFEESLGLKALVMEFVDGPTLADRIAQGPIPVDDALPIARQIADALEAAHEQGIIHRDLKPANIKLRPDGMVKVLDFGLAKAMEPTGVMSPSMSQSPTITTPAMTQAGMILGTAAYMSPEQARGKPVDKRADIWAFGCVLYEMLSGERAFAGEGISDVLASVLAREPDWTRLPASTPPRLLDLLRRLLTKDARDRLRDIGDARQEIGTARLDAHRGSTPDIQTHEPSGQRVATHVALGLSLVATVALAVPAVRHWREQAPAPREFRFDVESNEPVNTNLARFALSPDGRSLLYRRSSGGRLYLRHLDDLAPRELPGVAGVRFAWSPDSRSVVFFAGEDGMVKRVSLDGATPITVAPLSSPARGLAWGADGVILVATDEQLLRIPAEGGTPTVVITAADGVTYADPAFLPDGTHFTYRQISQGTNGGATAMLASLDGGAPRRLFPAQTKVEYVDPGVLLAGDGTHVHAYPFDLERLEVSGERFLAFEGAIWFSVSRTGDVAYRTDIREELLLNWVDRTGGLLSAVGKQIGGGEIELSPDDRFAATVTNALDIWLTDTARGVASRFTSAPRLEQWATWSPDSTRLLFGMQGSLMVSETTGAAAPVALLEDSDTKMPSDWSPDGRYVLYFTPQRSETRETRGDIWLMPFDKSRSPEPFIATEADESHAQFSPDGKWVSYDSDESGRIEVYVRPFQGAAARVRVSVDGGAAARWNPRGEELFFISPDGNLMSAGIRTASSGTTLVVDRPKQLFPLRTWTGGSVSSGRKIDYDVASDGNRFLVLQRGGDYAGWPIHVVANWQPRQSSQSPR